MNWDLAIWATGSVCALAGIFYGGRHIGRGASGVNEDVDPNQQLLSIVTQQGKQIERLNNDADRSKVRLSDLERDLSTEKERSDRHERRIGQLHTENQELRRSLELVQRIVDAWKTWHLQLVTAWHIVRQSETPPDGPILDPDD